MKLYTLDNKFIKETNIVSDNFTGKIDYLNGCVAFKLNGEYHRIGGPAYGWDVGHREYWIHGKCATKEKHDLLYSIMKLKGLA